MQSKKRFIIVVSILILLLPLSYGAEEVDITSYFKPMSVVQPNITISFQEPVEVDSVRLYGMYDDLIEKNSYLLKSFFETGNTLLLSSMKFADVEVDILDLGKDIVVRPKKPLFDGYYILELNVMDLVGNKASHFEYFHLNATGIDITIIDPRLGVSSTEINNLTIETKRGGVLEPTQCKIGVDDPGYDFERIYLRPFDDFPQWSSHHKVSRVFEMFGLKGTGSFYIVCKDRTLNRVTQRMFKVYVDTRPPVIESFNFVPPKIVEYPEGNEIFVYLNITTNEDTICRYSYQDDLGYDDMTPFDDYDLFKFNAYKKISTQKWVIDSDEKAKYTFYAQCEDRAGWKTSKKAKILEVDLSEGLGINVIFPPQYTTNKTIDLLASTNKRAVCTIDGGGLASETEMSPSTDQKTHDYNLGTFKDGTYDYTLRCVSASAGTIQHQTKQYTFIIDNTPPGKVNLTGKLVTCFNDKFRFDPPLEISADDPNSGIKDFMLEIKQGTAILLNKTEVEDKIDQIDEDSSNDPFELYNGTSYTFSISAVNGAGIEGTATTFTVKYDPKDEVCFEQNPPVVTIAENKTAAKTTVEFVCSDESGCDETKFYYGTGESDENCSAASLLAGPPFTMDVLEDQYVCYLAYDTVGNNATGSKLIEVNLAASCSDLTKNGDETDIDCGGSCSPCTLGMDCFEKEDCRSNFCDLDICSDPSCDDSIMNGPLNNEESDVDCGGYCSELGFKCDLNQLCYLNDDCKSGFCNPDEDVCSESSCDDGYKGPEETDVDCGGVCLEEYLIMCADGKKCKADEDCESGNCIGNICKQTEAQLPIETAKGFPIGSILMLLGILMILGGSGYLYYKKTMVPAETKVPERVTVTRNLETERRKAMEEARRKAAEERRKKEEEERKKVDEEFKNKREEAEKKKREKRERLFRAFGGNAPETDKTHKTLEMDVKEGEKEGWLSLSALKERIMPSAKLEKKAEETPTAPKPITPFEELSKIPSEKEKDVYKMLESIGKSEKKGAFRELESLGKESPSKDVYDELRKYIKPKRKSRK